MTVLLSRLTAPLFERTLGVMPVVVVTGARQTGKSTFVRGMVDIDGRPYLSLDDGAVRARALADPAAFVRESPTMIIDEVQRTPELILEIKRVVDEGLQQRSGQFILTGSANLLMMKRIADSLAGRALYMTMWPLTRRERLGMGQSGMWSEFFTTPAAQWNVLVDDQVAPRSDWRDEIRLGGFPRPAYQLRSESDRTLWLSGYVNTYLERDLQNLANIDNLVDFRRLMQAVCLRSGSLMNQTELGRDTKLPKTTVHRYLNLLETSYQLVRLPAYTVNQTTRLIKTAKLYWNDVALSSYLSGETEPRGAHLENFVLSDMVAWRDSTVPRPQIMYWRMANTDAEIDFVIEHGEMLLPIEIKSTTNPGPQDAAVLEVFLRQYGDRVPGGLLLYGGERTFWIKQRVLAVPWWKVL